MGCEVVFPIMQSVLDDAELMNRYARGDAAAFEELFGRYERRALGFYLRRTHCPDRAADLLQELFLRLHRFRDRFDSSQPFSPWFFEVARNVWHDDLRRIHRLREEPEERVTSAASRSGSPEQCAIVREEVEVLLGVLTRQQRSVVVATAVEGWSYADLAGRSEASVAALKQVGSRALRKLRHLARG